MHHASKRIFWLVGVLFFLYTADKVVELFSKTGIMSL
jgi:hypothetical protein